MKNKTVEIFIPGPAGRLEAKYYKSKKKTSPIALVIHPHPQYGGTMNNKVVVNTFHAFKDNGFSVCRVNFRGVGKSEGEFDNGQGELADAAAAFNLNLPLPPELYAGDPDTVDQLLISLSKVELVTSSVGTK